ncbi:MAG: serine hydrolase domain-containing protein [Pseudohongiellaceae bacterium]
MITANMQKISSTIITLLCLAVANLAISAEIPTATPEEVGMWSARLQRINTVIQRHIDAGDIQGAVTVVARRGKLVHFETHGLMDVENDRAMQDDSIFIMMSSTKPLLGVAAMMMIATCHDFSMVHLPPISLHPAVYQAPPGTI